MWSKFRKRILFSLALGALVFIALTIYADFDQLALAFARFDWFLFPVILLTSSINYAFRYFKWDYYTKQLGIRPSTKNNLIIFFASFIMALTPGKFGEVMKSYLLKKVNNTPMATSAPVILAERLTDFIGLVIIVIVGAWMFDIGRVAVAVFAVLFFGMTSLMAWRRGSVAIIHVLERTPFINKFAHHFHEAYESIYVLLRPLPLLVATVLSVISWFAESLGFWIVLNQFQAPPTMFKAIFIYAFSTIVGSITMLPGGLGMTEGSLTGLSVLAGVENSIAVASTFIIRAATLWYAVVLGIVVIFGFQHKLHVQLDELELETLESQAS